MIEIKMIISMMIPTNLEIIEKIFKSVFLFYSMTCYFKVTLMYVSRYLHKKQQINLFDGAI